MQASSEHPGTLDTVYNMGLLAAQSGDLAAAQALFVRAAEGRAKSLGPAHPDTALAYYSVGDVLEDQGKNDEARQAFREAAAAFKAAGVENEYSQYASQFL